MSYLLKPVSKSCRAFSPVNARGHNGKEMQQGSCALTARNAVNSELDKIFQTVESILASSRNLHVTTGLV